MKSNTELYIEIDRFQCGHMKSRKLLSLSYHSSCTRVYQGHTVTVIMLCPTSDFLISIVRLLIHSIISLL